MSEVPGNAPLNANAEVAAVQAQTTISQSGSGKANASTMVPNSMAALQREAPEVHRGILEGIANTILSRMRIHQRKMKELMKKGYKGSQ